MRSLTLLFFLLCLLPLAAQPGTTTLHLDRPYHAAGEVSWFRAYLPQPAPASVRAEIYGPDGQRLDYFFLGTTDGAADGYYRWGYDLPTGYYRIVLTALSADGQDVHLGTFRHAVYSVGDRGTTPTETVAAASPLGATNLSVRVEDGTLRLSDAPAGTYSLSVFNASVVGDRAGETVAAEPVRPAAAYQDTLFYRGQVTAADGGEAVAVNLLPVFDGTTFATYFSKSDPQGRFLLTVPAFEGQKTVQARDISGSTALVARLGQPRLESLAERPPLTEAVVAYLELSYRRRKIFQLYRTVETPLEAEPVREQRRPLVPSKAYNVQDYKAFPDLYTFFREVAGELRYRERRGSYTARLYNAPTQRFFLEAPLFIVDGRLTRDADYVARLDPAEVDRLTFYYGNRELREQFPALGNQGVVQIDRLRPADDLPAADAANLLTLNGRQPALGFRPLPAALPRISPLLLWQTGTTEGGAVSLPLPGTDDSGSYRVVVLLRDATGRQWLGTTTFTLDASR
ncbi:hypothetical protein [Neolewinella litorea]|uniref:hypothetical protein n=1 Tax=Neolewinella litorea TaxID=2562452 RepID=UPI001455E360|nr:hypothetical protein [Neolewinella litorea]